MKICLLDPGLLGTSGHHFDWAHKLVREAHLRGLQVTVVCHQRAHPQMAQWLEPYARVQALFSVDPYEGAGFDVASTALAADLAGLPDADLWLVPTLTLGLAGALAKMAKTPWIAACIHHDPAYTGASDVAHWCTALAELQVHGKTALGTTTSALAQAYTQLSGLPIDLWPLAHDGHRALQPRRSLRTVGILGHQRAEKGLLLIPDLVQGLRGLGLNVLLHDTIGQLQDPGLPGVQTVHGFVLDFNELLRHCDLVITPNDSASYRLGGSGVVWEALASGIPVLAPRHTFSGQWALQTGGGLCFDTVTPSAIVQSVVQAQAVYAQLAAAAFTCSQNWPQEHGVARFLDRALFGAVSQPQ